LVIQEAFAAKIPVIATNLGGMAEAVTHEVNGLLFERGDVDDLARQLRRVADEPGLLPKLRSGIPPVKTIEQEVTELETMYRDLVARK
jgi:glycosyltransferase involved in cell wall biosynthesis